MAPGFAGSKNIGQQAGRRDAAATTSSARASPSRHRLPTSTSSANTTSPANCGRSPAAGCARHPRCMPASPAMRATTTSRGAPRAAEHDGVFQRADQRRPQDAGALGHSVFRRILLRHRGYLDLAAHARAHAGRSAAPAGLGRAHRGADRGRGSAGLGSASRRTARPARQARAALHRRGQILVDRVGAAGNRHGHRSAPRCANRPRRTRTASAR